MTHERTGAPYFGKFRATVVDNIDPMQLGRVKVTVPDVPGATAPWATPCVPFAGTNAGILALPPVGAGVWVEFERGDPAYPIWVGGYWASAAEVPTLVHALPPGAGAITLQTTAGSGIVVSDAPGLAGGVLLTAPGGASISVSDAGILITNGRGASISMTGPTTDINAGALAVT